MKFRKYRGEIKQKGSKGWGQYHLWKTIEMISSRINSGLDDFLLSASLMICGFWHCYGSFLNHHGGIFRPQKHLCTVDTSENDVCQN